MPAGGPDRVGFWAVLAVPGVRAVLAVSVLARLPAAMTGLAIVLRVATGGGSIGAGGLAAGLYVIGGALAGPLLGRAADRRGRRVVLAGGALANATGMVALSLVSPRAPAWYLVVAVAAGALTPPVASAVRSMWPHVVAGRDLDALYAADSTIQELTFIAGPALVALVASSAGAAASLDASAAFGVVGCVALASLPALRALPPSTPGPHVRVVSRDLLALAVTGFLLVLSAGVVQLGVVAFCAAHRVTDQSGFAIAAVSVGAVLGGAAVGTRVSAAGRRGLLAALLATALGDALLVGARNLVELYPLLACSGLAVVPALGGLYALVNEVTRPARAVEAFAWVAGGTQAGVAGGSALGGLLSEHLGAPLPFLVAAAIALAAVPAILVLRPVAPPHLLRARGDP